MIPRGSSVLDVGTGSGALGRYLSQQLSCIVDGITHNEAEAQLARAHYRSVVVADLDAAELADLFADARYDYIVCADVLEHLRAPERVLNACHAKLAEDGRLLVSVPNAGYIGLIGELMAGEFRYREEGLLDRTHLRFYTRHSLLRFLAEHGFASESIQEIVRELPDSEFGPVFDLLPPAVSRYLLGFDDGLTYQFVISCRPCPAADTLGQPTPDSIQASRTLAFYTVELYGHCDGTYDEAHKLLGSGRIGSERQWLTFDLRGFASPPTRLRLDPADRPGLLRIHAIELHSAEDSQVWAWDGQATSLATCPAHQSIVEPFPWPSGDGAMLLLTGEDPWIELPVPAQTLAQSPDARLRIALSWPMSADCVIYAQRFAEQQALLTQQQERLAQQKTLLDDEQAHARQLLENKAALSHELAGLKQHVVELEAAHEAARLSAQETALALAQRCHDREEHLSELTEQLADLRSHLDDIHRSTVFRATRPLVNAKMKIDTFLKGTPPTVDEVRPPIAPVTPPEKPVDVIVPVYRGLEDTRRCIESVLSPQANVQTPFRLIVINDAGPEPELAAWLHTLPARDARIVLLENETNLGFVGTVNRGMALSDTHDVLLLNSDTEVAGDWLDRLRACAYSNPKAGTVTPASNNATICSYPRFCAANALPRGIQTPELDALFAATNAGVAVEIPTAVGFCMYIRRDCLTQTGLFDMERFGKGYGEENDFCMRAAAHGWHHLLALDVFVRHAGGVSFGAEKSPRERDALEILRGLYPDYETRVHRHVARDPAQPYRLAVDIARLQRTNLPTLLFIGHNRGGGTQRHIHELADALEGIAQAFLLRPASDGLTTLEWINRGEAFSLCFRLPDEFEQLLIALRTAGVVHVHVHHLLGLHPIVESIARQLGVEYDFTAHDYYSICPQISLTGKDNRFCGETGNSEQTGAGLERCRQCLKSSPAPGGVDILDWRTHGRSILEGARKVFAPSADTAQRLHRAAPSANIIVAPHADLAAPIPPAKGPVTGIGDRPLRVAVIGALSPIKGADVLETTAIAAARRELALDFHLLGYAYRAMRTQPRARLTIHGEYDEEDLPELLAWLEPDVVWFPAQWPETYSYTLSACLQAGLPVVAPALGAFSERLGARQWTWLVPWEHGTEDHADFFEHIRATHFRDGSPPELTPGNTAPPAHDYRQDYLPTISGQAPRRPLDSAYLRSFRCCGDGRPRTLTSSVKARTFGILVRLRSTRLLRTLARRIPLRWQTRMKTWLQS